ncbi:MAG: sugar phosphate isomerase/epimerase [Rhodothermales bacterium]|nr:sugar phosphate isomerase/epimerase [Rhodothermales bacterium]
MNAQLGVMQGRLVPKFEGRYQAHPIGYWQDEFALAAREGLSHIEFILDLDRIEENPLWSEEGRLEIRRVAAETGVAVHAICADCFLEEPVWQGPASAAMLPRVLEAAVQIRAGIVVMPVLEKATLPGPAATEALVQVLHNALDAVPGPRIALETELSPEETVRLLEAINHPRVGIAYDTGNHAAAGFSARTDWAAYGANVIHVHLKDRPLGGGSVHLGEGGVDFPGLLDAMQAMEYDGVITIQGYRDDEGVAVFRTQKAFVDRLLISAHQTQTTP